jgi:glycosyltransferase involved in cell wall biosynthesis
MLTATWRTSPWCAEKDLRGDARMAFIYFVGTYKPMMCGIGDYTDFMTRVSPAARWGVLSFDLESSGIPLATGERLVTDRVWYGIPSRHEFSAAVIQIGVRELGAEKADPVLWFQHEFGIWSDNMKFVSMLKNLDIPKVITFHTLHFQSTETSTGLRKEQCDLLAILLPHVEAITVFSRGVYNAVTSAFPQYREKVYIVKHGVHSYAGIDRLSRKEAKEKLNDFFLYESDLDQETKEILHKQRIFLDSGTAVIGQTGFLSPSKGSELLYRVRNSLQKAIPHKRIAAIRIGSTRDKSQETYAEELQTIQNGRDRFLLKLRLPENILPLAQRAFDVNFYWPTDCTQSGILGHALGAGAVVAGRDLEGLGETLKEAGELANTDLKVLMMKIQEIILNPELVARIEESALSYAAKFSWHNQARRHYELAEHIRPPVLIKSALYPPETIDTIPILATN